MNSKTIAAAAAAALTSSVALVATSAAVTTTSGAYSQSTSGLSCVGHVQGDGDGGKLFVDVAGRETRASDQHFRTHSLYTRMIAQEKNYAGVWVNVKKGDWVKGKLGPSHSNDAGTKNHAHFTWGGDTQPTLWVRVEGFDDLFRAKVVSRLYDDEGVLIKRLVTRQGQCRL